MALAGIDAKAAASDPFGLTNYNKLKADIDYLVVAGADLASAATITPTNEFHKVTGTATIDNLDYAGAVAGQQLRLWFTGAPTIRNNGGGAGNVRTLGGFDRSVLANEILTFVFDGTYWRETLGCLISHTEFIAAGSTSGASWAAGATLVTAPSYTSDGVTPIEIEFQCPWWQQSGAGTTAWWGLVDNGAQAALLARGDGPGAGYAVPPWRQTRRFIPSAGAHVYAVKTWVGAGTVTINAGDGSGTNQVPGWLEIRRALT